MATPAPLAPPPDEAIYEDLQAVKAALQEHAGQHGHSITVGSSREQRAVYICSKGGKYNDKGKKEDVHDVYELATDAMPTTAEEMCKGFIA
jgi:hypothetical protein